MTKSRGFSLVELSIVLVILGLLVGGVLTGQSLIRAAELRSVTTEFQKYQAATNTFRDKYFAIPGEMTNATAFWGAAHATPATCLTTVGTGTQTCNGNGDGNVWPAAAASQRGEQFAFWVHLANAGLIEGSYTGFAGSAGSGHHVIGINTPKAKMGNAGWSVFTIGNYGGDAAAFAFDYGTPIIFGGNTPSGTTGSAVLKPEEAWNIDTKLDDGKPGTGKIIAYGWDACTDAATHGGTTVSDRTGANYLLSDSNVQCALYFPKAF